MFYVRLCTTVYKALDRFVGFEQFYGEENRIILKLEHFDIYSRCVCFPKSVFDCLLAIYQAHILQHYFERLCFFFQIGFRPLETV